jgi:hypothetical protein
MWLKTTAIAAALATAALAAGGCGDDEDGTATTAAASSLTQGSEHVELDPAEFTTEIDNEWWPMPVGSRWVYRGTEDAGPPEHDVVRVTPRTREIANGVEARVVSDVVSVRGEPIEATEDWYAQDADGNVWYLGEDTAEYRNGKKLSTEGSFEAGVGGAEAGIIMPADPAPGMSYRQEYLKGEAEDTGAIISVGEEMVGTPAGKWDEVLMTRDLVPTEPGVEELKFYARGVGPVLTVHTDAPGREELVSYREGG